LSLTYRSKEEWVGSWGPGIFQNDSALDLVGELTSGAELRVLVEPLEYIASADADYKVTRKDWEALAAAEVVAAAKGVPSAEIPEEVTEWMGSGRAAEMDQTLVTLSLRAVERVLALPTDMVIEMWGSSDLARRRTEIIEDLRARLLSVTSDQPQEP
jgi:hypothetical protein